MSIEITNAKYFKHSISNENVGISCVMNGRHYCVPLAIDNTYYDEIMRQVDAGELTIEPADE